MKPDNHIEMAAAIRRAVPRRSGVYLFKDSLGKTMYVGKSVNLRQRMLSYFSAQTGVENRIREMSFNIRGFAFIETPTELLALLLEDQLIKKENPSYNIRQRDTQDKYLSLTRDAYPTCRMMDHDADFADVQVFGPFRDRYFVADVLDIIHRHLYLRACQDRNPFRHSLNFELGFCKAPCRDEISVAAYAAIVAQVKHFLQGDDTLVLARLRRQMADFAGDRAYEKAAALHKKIAFCERFCARQRFFQGFRTRGLKIVTREDITQTYAFDGDSVTWRTAGQQPPLSTAGATAGNSAAAVPEMQHTMPFSPGPDHARDERFQLDRANIVYNWIHRHRDECDYRFHKKE